MSSSKNSSSSTSLSSSISTFVHAVHDHTSVYFTPALLHEQRWELQPRCSQSYNHNERYQVGNPALGEWSSIRFQTCSFPSLVCHPFSSGGVISICGCKQKGQSAAWYKNVSSINFHC